MRKLHIVPEFSEMETMTDVTIDRSRGEQSAASRAADELLSNLLANAPPLDDEAAWAARDAKIQADRDRTADREARSGFEKRATYLVDDGDFPGRAISAALQPQSTAPLDAAMAWDPSRKSILVLCGDQGIGKTVAACAFVLRSSVVVWRYVRAATFQSTSRYDQKRRESFTAGAMVLDDLGAEYADNKGSFLADMDELVDYYYARPGKPLIITTNVSADQFGERYKSERMLGRLREAAVWREFGGAPCLRPPAKGGRK